MDTTPVAAAVAVSPVVFIGLDVSKDTLDVCLLLENKRHEKQFANSAAGHRQLLRRTPPAASLDTASCFAGRKHSPKEYSVTSAWKRPARIRKAWLYS